MNTWITSDWHLGENRFDLMFRPFKTTDEHNNTIINNHNSVVGKDDIVYVVGDAVYQKEPMYLSLVSKMNGRKILVRGNHDNVFTDEQLSPYFEKIIPDGDGIDLTIDNIECWLTHYPTTGRKDKFNIVGHVHSIFKFQLNMINVGVDVNHFYPVNLNKIPFFYKTIKDHYDGDAWVAYNEINTNFIGKRGKKGSYFEKKNKTM